MMTDTRQLFTGMALLMLLLGCQHGQQTAPDVQNTWNLDTKNSQFSFITTKNKTFAEEHRIQFKSGHIDSNNQVTLILDLATLDTGIPIRDERMKDILFDIENNPVIRITGQLAPTMDFDQATQQAFTLHLNGVAKSMQSELMVQSVNQDMMVTSFEPITVNAKDFGLDAGVNQLTKLAGLQSINYDISAEYTLRFVRTNGQSN